jgi:hypothetical protein
MCKISKTGFLTIQAKSLIMLRKIFSVFLQYKIKVLQYKKAPRVCENYHFGKMMKRLKQNPLASVRTIILAKSKMRKA